MVAFIRGLFLFLLQYQGSGRDCVYGCPIHVASINSASCALAGREALHSWCSPSQLWCSPIFLDYASVVLTRTKVFTTFALAKRFVTEEKTWPAFTGDPPTLVFKREDLQRIWSWEIASGHYPSRRRRESPWHSPTSPLK